MKSSAYRQTLSIRAMAVLLNLDKKNCKRGLNSGPATGFPIMTLLQITR
jgi:hypothetical protein